MANLPLLLKTNLKQLRLPTMCAEFEKLAREAAAANEDYQQYLLRLTELEVTARASNALQARIRAASFPREDLLQPIERQVVAELARDQIGQEGRSGQSLLDRLFRLGRRLDPRVHRQGTE